ncbi:MAG: DUF5017 domain-containing protein [Candidatus Cryptobacteroides sp.]
MKKLYICAAAALLMAASCQHDIVRPAEFTVSLDESNTYLAGDPVRFNFTGEVDNIIFYSGETGHQYKYRDRYTVPVEDVLSIRLDMNIMAKYGSKPGLEMYVTNTFEGLKGDDAQADKATVKALAEGGMQGWTRLEWSDLANKWKAQSYGEAEGDPDFKAMADNFCIAFHWCPPTHEDTQRWYYINGSLHLELDGAEPSDTDLGEMGLVTVMLNDEIEDPYHKNASNGSIILNKPNDATILCQGVAKDVLTYALDGWIFSTPMPLNRVANDKAVVIKNLQNYLHSYEYVFEEPGTYEVTFVGSNENYLQKDGKEVTMRITVLEKLD